MLIDLFLGFKQFVVLLHPVVVDDRWDQLNRSFMFLMMILMGGITTIGQHVGNIIACEGFEKFGGDFVADYCWTQGLYTVEEAYDKRWEQVPYPGIIPEDVPPCMEMELFSGGTIQCPEDADIKKPTRRYHLWYQWVPFYFWLVAIAFYMPYVLYRFMGFQEVLDVCKLCHIPCIDDTEMAGVADKAATWLYYRTAIYLKEGKNGMLGWFERQNLAFVTIFVKCLYLVISIIVLWLTASMFEIGNFVTYGEQWTMSLPRGQNASTAIRDKLFPKMVACEIKRWGTTGLEQERGFCILAPNVVNQYLFLIHWFCIVFLISTNAFSLMYSVVKIFFVYGSYRRFLANAFIEPSKELRDMYRGVGASGRLVLHVMSQTCPPHINEMVVRNLADKLRHENILMEKDL